MSTEATRARKRERDRVAQAKRRAADPEASRERGRQWRAANPERNRESVKASKQRQRAKDPVRFREEARLRSAAWAAANPGRRREISNRHTLKMYGLTLEDYEALLAAQNGGCAICGATSSGRKSDWGRLLVDHCHATGVVRGLLCHPCNQMLSNAKDSASQLRAAADYVERLPLRANRDHEDSCRSLRSPPTAAPTRLPPLPTA